MNLNQLNIGEAKPRQNLGLEGRKPGLSIANPNLNPLANPNN